LLGWSPHRAELFSIMQMFSPPTKKSSTRATTQQGNYASANLFPAFLNLVLCKAKGKTAVAI
jgi:hypothetical protein